MTAEIWTVVAICLLQFATYPPLAMHRLFCPRSAACLAGGLLLVAVAGRAQEIDPTAASAPPATESPSVQLLQDAREKLSSYRTLKAKIVETVEFGPRRFRAEGEYLQGLGNRIRLDLEVTIGENKGRLLQVSEGDVLWTVHDVGTTPRITRRDLRQILAAIKNDQAKSAFKAELGLGGLPALLSAIEQSIELKPPLKAAIEGREFYVLEGEWKPAILEQFHRQVQQQSGSTEPRPLPAHIPELVRLYLDVETLFPYRIRYLKQSSLPGEEPTPLLTIDFRDIVVNSNLDPVVFRYAAPEGANVADITKLFVQQLQQGQAQPTPSPPVTPSSSP